MDIHLQYQLSSSSEFEWSPWYYYLLGSKSAAQSWPQIPVLSSMQIVMLRAYPDLMSNGNIIGSRVLLTNSYDASRHEFLPGMRLAMDRALAQNNSSRVAEIDTRSEELQKELLKKANVKQGFEELADEIDALREEKQALLLEDANRTAMKQRLDELETFLDEQQEPVTDYDEGMVRRLIERIIVFEDHLDFEFKCGLETEVKM